MELLEKNQPTQTFVFQDVTFEFRTKVSSGDRFALDTAGALEEDGKVTFKPMEFYRALVRVFVVGWKGVTENGKDVPYSFETFMTRLPAGEGQDIVTRLGAAIGAATGIFKEKALETDLKNG